MEESRVETRLTRLGTSESRKAEKSAVAKGNIFAAFAQGGTEGEEEDEGSEQEQGKPSKGTRKTPGAPQARRVKEMPQTPTKEHTRSKGSTATKDITKDTGNSAMKAFTAIMEELKANRAQQEAQQTMVLDVVAALRSEIVALRSDNKALREELERSQNTTKAQLEEIEARTKSTSEKIKLGPVAENTKPPAWINTRPWSNPTNQEWPSLPQPQMQNQNQGAKTLIMQREAEARHFRERVVVVTLGKAAEEVKGKPLQVLKKQIQDELQKEEATKAVQAVAVAVPFPGKLELITGSKEQAQAARNSLSWVNALGEGAKAREALWYPLKVDGVTREVLCKKEGSGWEFKDDVLEIINKSNSKEGFQVKAMRVHWLSLVSDKTTGSIAVYFESETMVEQLLAEGIVLLEATAGCPHRYTPQIRPERCYNCNQYGHRQTKCRAAPRCSNCAAAHQTRNCKEGHIRKCAACNGKHRATDPQCPLYIKERERTSEQQRLRNTAYSQW